MIGVYESGAALSLNLLRHSVNPYSNDEILRMLPVHSSCRKMKVSPEMTSTQHPVSLGVII